MKFTTTAKQLKSVLDIVKVGIPSRPTHPVLAHYLFTLNQGVLEITATDLSFSITSKLTLDTIDHVDGSIVVHADIAPIINKLGSKSINCEVEHGQLIITYEAKGKVARLEVEAMDAKEYPDLDKVEGETLTIPSDQFNALKAAIGFNLHSVSTDATKATLQGINFKSVEDGLKLASTDGHRLGVYITQSIGEISATVPGNRCKHILDLDGEITIKRNIGYISFSDSQTRIITRLLDGEYPNYPTLIPSSYAFNFDVDAQLLLEAVELVSLVGNKELVKISVDGQSLKIESFKNTQVVAVEFVETSRNDGFKKVTFNSKYLISALKQFVGDVRFNGNTELSPHIITPVNSDEKLHLLMPLQMRE